MFQVTVIGLGLIFGCLGKEPLKFPANFQFAASTAAFTIEGGWEADGKGDSSWDYVVHNQTELFKSADLCEEELISQAEVAADSYHKWREDIKIAKELGLDSYEFSIANTRLLPRGPNSPVNQAGVDYYNNLINGLLKVGIEPIVTMYHYDGPVSGIIFYGGYSNPLASEGMIRFADLLFREYGDRVKQWNTFHDPYKNCKELYDDFISNNYEYFPYGEYEYLCGRNVLLAHASIYRMYEKMYKPKQNGTISMVFGLDWYEPIDATDKEAASRAMDFSIGWFLNPLVNGDYPERMTETIADLSRKQNYSQTRLPAFSAKEKALIKGTLDSVTLVHRNTYMVTDNNCVEYPPSTDNDVQIERSFKKEWIDPNSFFTTTPWGFRKAVKYVWDNYGKPKISISSAGYGAYHDSLNDTFRVNRLQQFLEQVSLLISEDEANIQYFSVWSLIDSFFFQYAYTVKFGMYQVNFDDPARPRTPKQSAKYYKNVIETRTCM